MTYPEYEDDELDKTVINDSMQDPEAKRLASIQAMYDVEDGELGKAMITGHEVDQLIFHRHILEEAVMDMSGNGLIGPDGFNMLSLGCGTGRLYDDEMNDVPINLDGIDISTYEGHRNPNMRFFQGSILNSPDMFDLKGQYHFIDSVFVMRYINAIPEVVLADQEQRGKLIGVVEAYRELTADDEVADRLREAAQIIETGEGLDSIKDVLNNPVIAKSFLLANWMDKVMVGGYMAHTITLQPHTSEDEAVHRTSKSVPRQIQSLRQILERRKDLGYGDFANILSGKVRGNMNASFGFLNALATEDVRREHEANDYFNKVEDVALALNILGRMTANAGERIVFDFDVMDAADTAYIKIKKIS